MSNIFWNRQDQRLRSGWRIFLLVLVYYLLAMILPILIGFITGPISDAAGLAGHIAASVEATGNFPLATNAPDYTARLTQFAHQVAALPLRYAVMAVTGLAVLWLAARLLDNRKLTDYGFHLNRRWWVDFGFGLLLGALLMAFVFLFETASGWLTVKGTFYSPVLPFWVLMILGLLNYIGVGLNEEILARGYALRNLAEGLHLPKISARAAFVASYLITSALFGAFHLLNANATWISTGFIMVLGLLLGLGYILTGELAIPIGIHISWNFFQGFVFGFPVSGSATGSSFLAIQQGGPVLWTGGAFGPEGGLVGILATALGCALVLLWVRWRYGKTHLQSHLAVYSPARVEPTVQAFPTLTEKI